MIMPLLSPDECFFIKDEIDENTQLSNKFFITMTWQPETIIQMAEKINADPRTNRQSKAAKIAPLEAWKVNQFHHYFVRLAKRTNSHLQAYGALNPEWENHHFHAILLSEKSIDLTTIRTTWDYCLPTAKNAKRYDKRQAAVPYIFSRHHGIQNRGRVYCPGVKKSCRNGNCAFEGGNILQRSA